MTFDLHYPNDKKGEMYKMWIHRIYDVASTLSMSYTELWELPEQEFLVLEGIAQEIRQKQEKAQKELLERQGNGNRFGR